MTTEQSPAEAIFFAALEKGAPAERVAYLDAACGDDDNLRRRVDRLLAAHPQVGSFLEPPAREEVGAAEAPTVPPREKSPAGLGETETAPYESPEEGVGAVIAGKYKLLETLGQGGMGAVFMAQQTQPVKRLVALKLIKLGMDSKQVLARFEAERQALALMDHPNIAKVLDAGTTDSGRPFFVMELVKGVPITQFCDARQLSPRQRLELFIPVCQAIQHAHQKGIIHRDIKPTNVLVALYDDRAVPKVIDFGVAKAAGLQLTDASLMTGFGSVVGTPEYMSPEQAQLNQLDIDTRSDVYALGVLLYELLTGTTPIDRKRLGQGALFEVLRMIREEEPLRPSTRLSTSDALASIAATRKTEPARLAKLMRGELDWIVMKCLEKDRSRRYETANGIAHDVERYLHDEVVEAQPPTAGYRLRKFGRKHRTALTTAAMIMLLLVTGTGVSSWQAVRAIRAEAAARKQRDLADVNRREAERIADRERTARQHALETIRDISKYVETRNLTTLTVADGLSVKGEDVQELLTSPLTPQEADLMNKLLSYYESAARHFASAADEPIALADAYLEIGRIRKIFRDYASAEVAYLAAIATYDKLPQDERNVLRIGQNLSGAHQNLAETLRGLGRDAEAVSHWDFVIRLSGPDEIWVYRLLRASALARAGRVAEALAECNAVVTESAGRGLCCYDAACVYAQAAAHSAERREEFARAGVGLLRRALEKGGFTQLRPTVALAYLKLDPDLDSLRGRKDFKRVAAAAFVKIVEEVNHDAQWWLKNIEPVAQDLLPVSAEDAEPILRKCLAIHEEKAPDDWTTFNAKSMLGAALLGQKKYAEAEPLLLAGYEGMKKLQKDKAGLTASLERLVQLYEATGKKDKADAWRKKLQKAKDVTKTPAKP